MRKARIPRPVARRLRRLLLLPLCMAGAAGVLARSAAHAAAAGATDARFLRAAADCAGPRGPFQTTLHSAADGRMRFEQSFPDGRLGLAGVDSAGCWSWDEWAGAAVQGTPEDLLFVRGHEFHALDLWPESRLGAPLRVSRHKVQGHAVERLEYHDGRGAPLVIEREVRTGRMRSLRMTNPAPTGARDILVEFGAWRPVDGIDVFHQATLQHGDARWEYRFTRVEFLPGPARMPRPAARTDAEQLLALHESALRAHRRSDPDELLAPEQDDYVVANRGQITHPRKAARHDRFADYLGRTRFRAYRDLVPPEVKVSADGTLGWVLAQVQAEGDQTPADSTGVVPVDFTCAWIELYEKRDGRWWRTGNVSNFME